MAIDEKPPITESALAAAQYLEMIAAKWRKGYRMADDSRALELFAIAVGQRT